MAGKDDDTADEELTANPGGMFAAQGDEQNGKSRDWIKGAGMAGTQAQDHADRRGKAGAGMADQGPPSGTRHGPAND